VVPPGSTIGILGGGQLGRMLAMAAAQLGYRCHIFDADRQAPAAQVAAAHTQAAWVDEAALEAFAAQTDVVTFEWENVPLAVVSQVSRQRPVFPAGSALAVAQDRLNEKRFAEQLGIAIGPMCPVDSRADLDAAISQLGLPLVIKSRRLGYDGKGQARIHDPADAQAAWTALAGSPAIAEAFVSFDREISVIVTRAQDGAMVSWGPIENVHEHGILRTSTVPADISFALADLAIASTRRIAEALDYVGTLAVEYFVVGDQLLFNEMAPRVHNSGHWTIEGSTTSQFENHIRAICGLPLGASDVVATSRMANLIGDECARWAQLLADPQAHVHLYGKQEASPGRKMGHVTWVGQQR
jgi:5-(carboxyamino)imidazole ribonucleotide synthase